MLFLDLLRHDGSADAQNTRVLEQASYKRPGQSSNHKGRSDVEGGSQSVRVDRASSRPGVYVVNIILANPS